MAGVDMTLSRGTDATSQPYGTNSNIRVGCLSMLKEVNYKLLEKFLSTERIGTYLCLADDNRQKTIDLYIENLKQCQIFYAKLHWLEIGLRNAINSQFSQKYGVEWFNNPHIGLNEKDKSQIQKAKNNLEKERKEFSNGNLVAELNFGFWVNLFNKHYDTLWRQCLRKVFTSQTGVLERKQLSKTLHPILKLRNRIAHYEPILDYDLPKIQQDIIDIVRLIEPNITELP